VSQSQHKRSNTPFSRSLVADKENEASGSFFLVGTVLFVPFGASSQTADRNNIWSLKNQCLSSQGFSSGTSGEEHRGAWQVTFRRTAMVVATAISLL